jgi:RNA polymerase sigma factor (sigma-70 family)
MEMRAIRDREIQAVLGASYSGDAEDRRLVELAEAGDGVALERLVQRHQVWIYNVALRMVGRPEDAEDVTQEVLVKVITKLSSFEGRSSFRTWLYRIVSNHVISMRRRPWERLYGSFERHGALIDSLADERSGETVEQEMLIEGAKAACMTGMLLCLDREQRLVMILGGIFGVDSRLGAAFLEVTPDNFRQMLSRARKQLKAFMEEKCGLMNPENPCRCPAKTRAAIRRGLVHPETFQFSPEAVRRVSEFVAENTEAAEDGAELAMIGLFRDHPLRSGPGYSRLIRRMTQKGPMAEILGFNGAK